MRAETENPVTAEVPGQVRPIELVTENGFSIVRQWEVDRVPPPQARSYAFVVRDSNHVEREIIVDVASVLLEQLGISDRQRLSSSSSFWICCAERHLASYLWEKEDCPPNNKLSVQHLDPEEVILATRWERTEEFAIPEAERITFDWGGLTRWLIP